MMYFLPDDEDLVFPLALIVINKVKYGAQDGLRG